MDFQLHQHAGAAGRLSEHREGHPPRGLSPRATFSLSTRSSSSSAPPTSKPSPTHNNSQTQQVNEAQTYVRLYGQITPIMIADAVRAGWLGRIPGQQTRFNYILNYVVSGAHSGYGRRDDRLVSPDYDHRSKSELADGRDGHRIQLPEPALDKPGSIPKMSYGRKGYWHETGSRSHSCESAGSDAVDSAPHTEHAAKRRARGPVTAHAMNAAAGGRRA